MSPHVCETLSNRSLTLRVGRFFLAREGRNPNFQDGERNAGKIIQGKIIMQSLYGVHDFALHDFAS
jgi:hypothetical protein